MKLTECPFTPSELILLNADKFAPEVETGGHELLCSIGMVNGQYLAVMMAAAAILANEEEGALEIELKEEKRLFSSNKGRQVHIHPIGHAPNWNGYTLESAVLFTAGQLFAVRGDYSARNVIYSVLRENRKEPWQKLIEFVEWGLATSNWLVPVEGDAENAIETPFVCPDKVQELAFSQPLGPVKNLFSSCKTNNPELWKILLSELDLAIKDRSSKK